jgi:thiol-disulfide isomerase/thioredoxin/Flp pilus assembly protein TadD
MSRVLIAVLLAAALAAFAQSGLSDAEQQHLRESLGRATNSPQDIMRALEQHLQQFPNSPKRPEIERALVKAAIETHDDRRIVLYGERVLSREPDDVQVLDQTSRALVRSGDAESAGRALKYAQHYEQVIAAAETDKSVSGAEQAKRRDTLDNSTGRALLLQAQAQAALGNLEEAVKLARRAFDVYPGASTAGEMGRWLIKLGRFEDAARAYADAFTVSDPKISDLERAGYRRRLGEAYTKWKGSEAGLGDLVLQAYDRNLAKTTERLIALKKFDPNLGVTNPMEFTITGVNGDKLQLSSLAGKVIVLDFWATWCGPCRIQHPLYEQVKKKFKGRDDLVFLAIDTDEERDLVKPFLDANKWQSNVYFEDGLGQALRVSSIPTTIIFDKRGNLAGRMNGFDPDQFVTMLSDRIEEALK